MTKFSTINPTHGTKIDSYDLMAPLMLNQIVKQCQQAQIHWQAIPPSQRAVFFENLAKLLREQKTIFARLMGLEMGKPILEGQTEIEKCAWTAELYAQNGAKWLEDENYSADGLEHMVSLEALGVILSIMPWNFPFWQAFRFAIPTLLAGNASILKHSNTVPQCALAIENLFRKAGFPEHLFRTVIADHKSIENLIQNDAIKGVSLTGSTEAGAHIAAMAGKHLKKVVLELGGSDPFIVLKDADLDFTAKNASLGRLLNAGQSCIAAKRFIVHEEIADRFSKKLAALMEKKRLGDPLDEKTEIGPLSSKQTLETLSLQIKDAVQKGAKILTGGKRKAGKGYFFLPTVLTHITPDMKVMSEEVFGPVAPVMTIHNDEEAVAMANRTEFGLGCSIWTKDLARGRSLAQQIHCGMSFINSIVKSDPRLPFGGIKKSGIGRELTKYGLMEFVNIKTYNIYPHGRT